MPYQWSMPNEQGRPQGAGAASAKKTPAAAASPRVTPGGPRSTRSAELMKSRAGERGSALTAPRPSASPAGAKSTGLAADHGDPFAAQMKEELLACQRGGGQKRPPPEDASKLLAMDVKRRLASIEATKKRKAEEEARRAEREAARLAAAEAEGLMPQPRSTGFEWNDASPTGRSRSAQAEALSTPSRVAAATNPVELQTHIDPNDVYYRPVQSKVRAHMGNPRGYFVRKNDYGELDAYTSVLGATPAMDITASAAKRSRRVPEWHEQPLRPTQERAVWREGPDIVPKATATRSTELLQKQLDLKRSGSVGQQARSASLQQQRSRSHGQPQRSRSAGQHPSGRTPSSGNKAPVSDRLLQLATPRNTQDSPRRSASYSGGPSATTPAGRHAEQMQQIGTPSPHPNGYQPLPRREAARPSPYAIPAHHTPTASATQARPAAQQSWASPSVILQNSEPPSLVASPDRVVPQPIVQDPVPAPRPGPGPSPKASAKPKINTVDAMPAGTLGMSEQPSRGSAIDLNTSAPVAAVPEPNTPPSPMYEVSPPSGMRGRSAGAPEPLSATSVPQPNELTTPRQTAPKPTPVPFELPTTRIHRPDLFQGHTATTDANPYGFREGRVIFSESASKERRIRGGASPEEVNAVSHSMLQRLARGESPPNPL